MEQSPSGANRFSASQEIPRIYWTRIFITSFTSGRHMSLSWASSIQSILPYPTSWKYILIFSYHLRLGLPSGLFPSGITKHPVTASPFPICATCPAHPTLDFISRTIYCEQSFLGPNIPPKHPILKWPQPTFLPQCEWTSYIHIKQQVKLYLNRVFIQNLYLCFLTNVTLHSHYFTKHQSICFYAEHRAECNVQTELSYSI